MRFDWPLRLMFGGVGALIHLPSSQYATSQSMPRNKKRRSDCPGALEPRGVYHTEPVGPPEITTEPEEDLP